MQKHHAPKIHFNIKSKGCSSGEHCKSLQLLQSSIVTRHAFPSFRAVELSSLCIQVWLFGWQQENLKDTGQTKVRRGMMGCHRSPWGQRHHYREKLRLSDFKAVTQDCKRLQWTLKINNKKWLAAWPHIVFGASLLFEIVNYFFDCSACWWSTVGLWFVTLSFLPPNTNSINALLLPVPVN